jgi:CDP-glucose 4,6-dehydratase
VLKGRKVFVTGHTGFKGSWLALWLSDLGAEVTGYALEPPTKPNMFEDLRLQDRLRRHIIADVRDAEKLTVAIFEAQPDIIMHFAAQPLVRTSYEEPAMTYETNVMGTVNLFEAARMSTTARVVLNVTSDKCYENREWVYAYREIDPMGGFDPYSSSKGCAELVTSAYRRSFFADEDSPTVVSVRAGNVIGGGDWAIDRLVPDCVRSLTEGESILVRNPEAVRPWQHVLEPLSGYLWLAALAYVYGNDYSGGWNFGPLLHSTVRAQHIVEGFIQAWGEGNWHTDEKAGQPHEAGLLKLDCTKANSLLEWHPLWGIDKAIDATADWYRAHVRNEGDAALRTLDQIDEYVSEAASEGIAWALDRELAAE